MPSTPSLSVALAAALLGAIPAMAVSDIGSWTGLRGTQIQTKMILEGGLLTRGVWVDNTKFSSLGLSTEDPLGIYYQIDLTKSFNAKNDNTSNYLIKGPSEFEDTDYPTYIFGAIFANAYQWYTFGGLASKPPVQGITTVMQGDVFKSSPDINPFTESVHSDQGLGVANDFITSGAYTSAPDLGLGWLYGGMVSANRTELEYNSDDDAPNHPTVTNNNFMKVIMPASASQEVQFQYMRWPDGMVPRSEGGLVWLPYGEQGVLIAIGGVEVPADLFLIQAPRWTPEGHFMTELAIYDIAADQWHTQNTRETSNSPSQLAAFCTAVVPTQDKNGFEIFVYGGYDGTYNGTDPNVRDDVWVLSVPAFQWTKFIDSPSTGTHGRQGSVCLAPNPSSIISVGGSGVLGSTLGEDSIIDVLDLNKKEWTGVYDASSSDPFILPADMVTQLGYPDGNGPGASAQATNLNTTGDLNTLFSKRYTGQVTQYWPYANVTNNSTGTNGTNGTNGDNGGNGKHSNTALIAALATVIPVVIIAAIVAFCCVKRRRKNKEGEERTQESRGNVRSWLRKSSTIDPAPEKSHTSDDTAVNSTEYTNDKQPISEVFEAPDSGPTTPGWGHHGHGSPRVLSGSMATSPFMGSAEVDAHSRHEIDGQSFRQHPLYPRSFSGDQVMSVRSDSISHASTSVMPSRHYGGYVSPSYELPQDRSREDLTAPPEDVNLGAPRADANPNSSTHSLGLGAEHVHSPVALLPVAPFPRKPVSSATQEDNRPGHQRNQSSMSSDLPNLPSPGPEEDRRRSRLLDTLPEPRSPTQPQTAKRSVYKEDLDS